ncbi:hypothetical protein KIN20_025363 [Parelaphostrongylus tenuis]|uniref:Uncharacterized protein n=1 Tax=Parelaphostrongylus tenuis TaxID=148309 RepID=A0AAD5N8R6_PARTN|nr:hypothetical protein KIN20_025363 [Parelaphostrongylus tenuis]
MMKSPTDRSMIPLLATFSTVLGCGVLPAGQASTRTFTVSGFTTLPVAMFYTDMIAVSSQVTGIATSKERAQTIVSRLTMQTVFDVLERQARSALLPDFVISGILNQLEVRITYEPLLCQRIVVDVTAEIKPNVAKKGDQYCIVVSNTVTGICTALGAGRKTCTKMGEATITPVPANHTSISGTLSTTNIVMASWSRMMWQSVVDRAVRMLASAPFGSHFFSVSGTVGGN